MMFGWYCSSSQPETRNPKPETLNPGLAAARMVAQHGREVVVLEAGSYARPLFRATLALSVA